MIVRGQEMAIIVVYAPADDAELNFKDTIFNALLVQLKMFRLS